MQQVDIALKGERKGVLQGVTFGWLLIAVSTAAGQNKFVNFSGSVVDSAKKPLANAEISISGMNLSRITDDKGMFRMEAVTSGVHHVTVRKVGFAQLDTSIVFPEEQDVAWRVTMTEKLVVLDSIIVSAPRDPLLEEFESNRKRGFGRFMTRADLAKVDGVSFPNVLRSLQGADIIRTNGSTAYITSKRGPISGCPPPPPAASPGGAAAAQEKSDRCLRQEGIYYVPDPSERMFGVRRACFPQVYLDHQFMNQGRPTPPFDVGSLATEQIEAIEWYASESQTPPKYSVNNARCGVLVIHLRKMR
jgi:hypothetical protein